MQARAPLTIEHRLIERMIEIIKRMLHKVEKEKSVDPLLVDKTIDFIRTYADKTHLLSPCPKTCNLERAFVTCRMKKEQNL
ncbi:conserved domain protein [delta proteobacterium NaphS2]|nr:conserved domain protein [delta proteobacterium NaphS2]